MVAAIFAILMLCFTIWGIVDVWKIKRYTSLKKVLLTIFIWFLPPVSIIIYYFCFSSKRTQEPSNVYDEPQPYDDTSCSGSSHSPKSFSSLQEFCDYLNSHDESEWKSELKSIISWNNWTDKTDCYNKICSNGFQYVEYDSDYHKYKVWTEM